MKEEIDFKNRAWLLAVMESLLESGNSEIAEKFLKVYPEVWKYVDEIEKMS